MADNITIPATGSGTATPVVATDDAGAAGHVQLVKLAISTDGSATLIPAEASNGLDVDVTRIQGGNVADDGADSGNPVKLGAKVKNADGTDPGSVSAEDDRADLTADRNRRLYVNSSHANFWRANENHSSAQTNNELKAAPGTDLSLHVETLIISNGATAGNVKLVEDTGGTPADIAGPYYFAANGGIAVTFKPPLRLTANKNLGFTSVSSTTHTVTVSGYTAP